MEGKSLIIFDKDGTLMDSSPGSVATIKEMAKRLGKELPPDEEIVRALCGPFGPVIISLLGLDKDRQNEMLLLFVKVYYEQEGYKDFVEYPDMPEVIRELSGRHMLEIATMMYDDFAVRSMKVMGVEGCFLKINGVGPNHLVSKTDLIRECMEAAECTPEETVMVGDSMDDLESARKAGVEFIGVTYGFGLSIEECEKEGIPYAESPKDLLNIL
ncbi:MAG: hypothetical protein E7Z65_07610 [Thermoplasmata archaeon]|nr:hypothetical protein [Thermoplasmata archaeon]